MIIIKMFLVGNYWLRTKPKWLKGVNTQSVTQKKTAKNVCFLIHG